MIISFGEIRKIQNFKKILKKKVIFIIIQLK